MSETCPSDHLYTETTSPSSVVPNSPPTIFNGMVACKNYLCSLDVTNFIQNSKNASYDIIIEPMSTSKSPFLINVLHAASVRGRTWAQLRMTSLKEPSCMVQYVHTLKIVNLCVAPGCSNTLRDRVSLHKFPSDPKLREKQVKQDRRIRDCAQWRATKLSVPCSKYFTKDSF